MYHYRVTRITPNNNVSSEERLNELAEDGYRVVAWAPFNMEVVMVMEKEETPVISTKTQEGRTRVVTVTPEE